MLLLLLLLLLLRGGGSAPAPEVGVGLPTGATARAERAKLPTSGLPLRAFGRLYPAPARRAFRHKKNGWLARIYLLTAYTEICIVTA